MLAAAVPPSPPALRAIARIEQHARGRPRFWLGARWHGLSLVNVDTSLGEMGPDLTYADCSWFQMNTASLQCHTAVEIEEEVPARGEISTQGGCIFSTRVRGATVAEFRVDPTTMRVFLRGTTLYVTGSPRRQLVDAIRSLRGIAPTMRFEPRPVSVGPCRPLPPKPRRRLSPKQRYERAMRASFYIESTSAVRIGFFKQMARPEAVAHDWVSNVANLPALLRNEAIRVSRIQPPRAVAPLHRRLISALRSHSANIAAAVRAVRADDWKQASWAVEEARLQRSIDTSSRTLYRLYLAFHRAGYVVAAKPGD